MKRISTQFLGAVLIAYIAILAGCQSLPQQLKVWVAPDSETLTDVTAASADPMLIDPSGKAITLAGAANETLCFQLVIDPANASAGEVIFSWSDLAGPETIKAGRIKTFHALPVDSPPIPPWHIRLPDRPPKAQLIYDKLQELQTLGPIEGSSFTGSISVRTGERVVIWIDLEIPRNALPGTYSGDLKVTSNGSAIWQKKLTLEVHDFTLPDAQPIVVVGGFDHADLFRHYVKRDGQGYLPSRLDSRKPLVRKGLTVMRQLMQLAHNHRLDLFDRRIAPKIKRDRTGKVQLDFTDYDAIVGTYLDGSAFENGIPVPAWPTPISTTWPDPQHYGGPDSDSYRDTIRQVLAITSEHFGKLTKSRRTFFWPWRGKPGQLGYDRSAELARIAKQIDPDMIVLSTLPASPPKLTGWQVPADFDELTDIYAPDGKFFTRAKSDQANKADLAGNNLAGTWLRPGQPPYAPSLGLLATPSDIRALTWLAIRYGCSGVMIDEVLNWDKSSDQPDTGTGLFYRGPDGPVASARLKRFRRAMQDAAYIWLLQQHNGSTIADEVVKAIVKYAGSDAAGDHYQDARAHGWSQSARAWFLARRILADELTKAINPDRLTRQQKLAISMNWQELRNISQTVRVEQIRARIADVTDTGRADAIVEVDLYNEMSWPTRVAVGLIELPEGFVQPSARAFENALAPGERTTLTLRSRSPYLTPAPKAKLPLTVELESGKQRRRFNCEIAMVISGSATKAPTIDGSLDDWPLRKGNAAGNFVLLGAQPGIKPTEANRQTIVFVTHDEQNLYFAIRCREPNLGAMVARPSNVLSCKQLMLYGEDMVEILLDPGNSAATAEDLYHLVIKPNGVTVAERGITCEPPLGRTEPWPLASQVAIGKTRDGWVVELAIPREAFGAAGKERLWGANFMRFSTGDSESSSWAPATRHYYDPRGMGVMILAEPLK